MKLDKTAEIIAGLGVPGLVLFAAMAFTGYFGAAATTTALAALGGPIGMLGGIGVLCLLALISRGLTKWGFETIGKKVIEKLIEKGDSIESIKTKIDSYKFVSKDLKLNLKDFINNSGKDDR